ncbi:DNA polymerase III subunit epsilon [Bradyrhizobium elkanii]|uniref:DNA polymerase III subunit epsilon n=1 Tax=Bradyrhizobium elkanii TaxID=29448 RepID=UPI00144957E1|nr:DNA polymerase III subunit epsilon [Bradyrhizobium elkanii]MCP1932232.1 DNA polymerase-3 subunit epsilon [Bradyrhizobium elkanii]MCS3577228.1 DNA polymerase-3 subunit epsilon [Bradyrhizobium elkanii]MCS3720105.1 DNA polymerase-3 subunit epsilon [Bradyrhizobium elkanii]MCS4004522.1 DNA polymerase-3 subunit epsilon [Bradyrhizobium elkanii USDA 61]BBB99679.1 DNA polymerase III epsilon chain DnaQ [Bradyrhizobium elkanii USDA 61]
MREIIIDTETTGIERKVDRIVEIGCVEINNWLPTGKTFHKYVNPTHPVHREAFAVHGLSNEFLKTKPTFKRVVNQFLAFIGDARLVAHNAPFDLGMINDELDRLDMPPLQNEIVDTLELAKAKRPRGRHTLDGLCSAFNIDTSRRKLHGALLDAELLSEVYVELRGGRQYGLTLLGEQEEVTIDNLPAARQRPVPLPSRLTDEERRLHAAFVETLGEKAIWREYR